MPAFSITAPQISEEEEKRERDALTEAEREQSKNDLYGLSLVEETDELVSQAPYRLLEAMERIPVEQKGVYLEALARAPDLVASESPPLAFMRRENFEPDKVSKQEHTLEVWVA
jgi:hypothetical protein